MAAYVYQLVVVRPAGSDDPDWLPPGWEALAAARYWDPEHFDWPREHLYLSASGAEKRAQLLRSWGCTVAVVRSQPVEFLDGGQPGAQAEYRVRWRRLGAVARRQLYQSLAAAQRCAARQATAAEEMDWVEDGVAPLVYGPCIEVRAVGAWVPLAPYEIANGVIRTQVLP